jgi:hypothetical protein
VKAGFKKYLVVTGVVVAAGSARAWYKNKVAQESFERELQRGREQLADPQSDLVRGLRENAAKLRIANVGESCATGSGARCADGLACDARGDGGAFICVEVNY